MNETKRPLCGKRASVAADSNSNSTTSEVGNGENEGFVLIFNHSKIQSLK